MPFRQTRRVSKAAANPVGRATRELTAREARISSAFLGSIRAMTRRGVTPRQVYEMVTHPELGIPRAIGQALDMSEFAVSMQPLVEAVRSEVIAGGVSEIQAITGITGAKGMFRFDAIDPRAYVWAEARAGELIAAISAEQRDVIRRLVSNAVEQGIPVDDLTEQIQQSIGLHDRWSQAVENTRSREYERARSAGATHTAAKRLAGEAAQRQSKRLLQARARNIARTEIITANNEGRRLSWVQGVEGGYISPTAVKRWSTGPLVTFSPSRIQVCDECRSMFGEEQPWDQPFSNGVMMPPAHPSCRCSAVLVPTDIAEVRRLLDPNAYAATQPSELASLSEYGVNPTLTMPREISDLIDNADDKSPEGYRRIQQDPRVQAWRRQVTQEIRKYPDVTDAVREADIHVERRLSGRWTAKAQEAQMPVEVMEDIRDRFVSKVQSGSVVVNVPQDVLGFIVEDGRLMTQFETGTSKGVLNNFRRSQVEESLFGLPRTADPRSRPIYGSIADRDNIALSARDGMGSDSGWYYGETRLILKPSVKSRTSITATDSLDQSGNISATLASNPDRKAAWVFNPQGYTGYVEAQIWGGVTMDDVEEILINGDYYQTQSWLRDPDKKDLVERLRKRGIRVRYKTRDSSAPGGYIEKIL